MADNVHQPISTALVSRRVFLSAGIASLLMERQASATTSLQTVLRQTLRQTNAVSVIANQQTGRTLAQCGDAGIATTPGSILKPLILYGALQRNLVTPTTTFFCRRELQIDGRPYPCSHPQSNVSFTAQEALAYSCNTWFATLALRMSGQQIADTLRAFHLRPISVLDSPEEHQLLVLGLRSIVVRASEVATAYSILARGSNKLITDGLRDSVSFGMAHNADAAGLEVSGKTGTANRPPREPWSHGWFAGYASIHDVPLTISVYLPQGNGADAASLARKVLLACNEAKG